MEQATMRKVVQQPRNGERGQALVLFALMMTAVMGMMAVGLDLGFMYGQRRLNQNGADAAALAVSRLMAKSVSFKSGGSGLYFTMSDAQAYQQARHYAGLPD